MTIAEHPAALAGGMRAVPFPTDAVLPSNAGKTVSVIGVIGLVWLCAASRWIASDTVVPWDSKNQFYAFFRFLASALHSGGSPFWNPYHYGGHPSIADPQSLIFAPAFFLWALFDEAPSIRIFDLIVYAHLLFGGLAVGLIGVRQRWPVSACVLAAAVFMFGGVAAGRLHHTGAILAYALFPPALLLLQVTLARRSMLCGLVFSFVFAALLLGRNQTALLLALVLSAAAFAAVATAVRPLRYLRERLPVFMVMGAVTAALIAVPMLLTLQFTSLSNRPAELLDHALKGSLHPMHLAQLAVPDIFGAHRGFWGPGAGRMPDIAQTDEAFAYWFVGAVPFVLLVWLGIAGGGALRRGRILLTVTIATALAFALGRYTPLYGWVFEWLPGASKFRRPTDANFVAMAALAILTGHLLSDYVRSGVPRGRSIANAVVAAVAVAMIGWSVAYSAQHGHGTAALLEALKGIAIVAGVVLALWLATTPGRRGAVAAALALVAIAELMWWNVDFRLNAEHRSVYAVLEKPKPADAAALDLLRKAVGDRRAAGERPRVEIFGMGGPWQNVAMVQGLEATNGYNPLRTGRYDRLVSPGESTWLVEQRKFPASFEHYDCALSRALGLGYVVIGRPIEQVPQLALYPITNTILAGPTAWIYQLGNPTPRVTFTQLVQVADVDSIAGSGKMLESLSADRALIDDDTPPSAHYAGAATGKAGHAAITTWRTDRVEIDAESETGGMLVLHDLYYPGWIAEIDGKPAPILRADVLFRGVEVPPGRHRVVFRYAPLSLDNLWAAFSTVIKRR